MFIDTHAHFDADDGVDRLRSIVERAVAARVDHIIAVGGSTELNAGALSAARAVPERISVTLGYDRDQAPALATAEAAVVDSMAALRATIQAARADSVDVVGIGETGLDFHYTPETADAQMRLFRAELNLARELGLPVVVHSREADDATVTLLREHAAAWRGPADRIGVLHCFTGGQEFAQRVLELGFHVSFSGIVTFRNADALRAVAACVPADRLLIETDSPYLAPAPMRGKRNEPAYLPHVAEVVARVRGVGLDEIGSLTTRNALQLFGGRTGGSDV